MSKRKDLLERTNQLKMAGITENTDILEEAKISTDVFIPDMKELQKLMKIIQKLKPLLKEHATLESQARKLHDKFYAPASALDSWWRKNGTSDLISPDSGEVVAEQSLGFVPFYDSAEDAVSNSSTDVLGPDFRYSTKRISCDGFHTLVNSVEHYFKIIQKYESDKK